MGRLSRNGFDGSFFQGKNSIPLSCRLTETSLRSNDRHLSLTAIIRGESRLYESRERMVGRERQERDEKARSKETCSDINEQQLRQMEFPFAFSFPYGVASPLPRTVATIQMQATYHRPLEVLPEADCLPLSPSVGNPS